MKKQILCALSVAALAATMLTVPVYAAEGTPTIRVEGESYKTDQNWKYHPSITNEWCPGGGINMTSGSVPFNEEDKPYVSYTFNVDKAGIYDLEYKANYLEDKAKTYIYLSPFSVTLNGNQIFFKGDTPNNDAMISYKAPAQAGDGCGTYKLPVYLNEGSNTITFTVEGGRCSGGEEYVFYLDYFQFAYNEKATKSDAIQVEAEDLIAGNVPSSSNNILKMTSDSSDSTVKKAASIASNQTMYRFNNGNNVGGYLEYIVPSATEGDFNLEITGSNTDKTTGLKSWCGDFDVVINDGTRISVGDGVTPNPKEDVYDIMTANKTVKLKQGLNKIKVELDEPDNNGRYLIHLDYLKFTPVVEPEVQELQAFGGNYEQGTGTAEFTATGLDLSDLSKLVFGFTKGETTEYKYYKPDTTVTDEGGSANIAVRLTGIEGEPDAVRLVVSDFEVKEVE